MQSTPLLFLCILFFVSFYLQIYGRLPTKQPPGGDERGHVATLSRNLLPGHPVGGRCGILFQPCTAASSTATPSLPLWVSRAASVSRHGPMSRSHRHDELFSTIRHNLCADSGIMHVFLQVRTGHAARLRMYCSHGHDRLIYAIIRTPWASSVMLYIPICDSTNRTGKIQMYMTHGQIYLVPLLPLSFLFFTRYIEHQEYTLEAKSLWCRRDGYNTSTDRDVRHNMQLARFIRHRSNLRPSDPHPGDGDPQRCTL